MIAAQAMEGMYGPSWPSATRCQDRSSGPSAVAPDTASGPPIHVDAWRGVPGDALAPYVPRLLVEWMREAPESTHRAVAGTLAFVDISGFTKMSERLARHGKVGAEDAYH